MFVVRLGLVFLASYLVLSFSLFFLGLWPNMTSYETLIMNQFILQNWFKFSDNYVFRLNFDFFISWAHAYNKAKLFEFWIVGNF